MNIALIGYGKMGKAIESIAFKKGHEIVLKIDIDNAIDLNAGSLQNTDVAIEFTGPNSAVNNIKKCIDAGTPVVSGSTGWLDKWNEVKTYCEEHNGTLLYASNYSIGVNLFFELNKFLSQLMEPYADYNVEMTEVHHSQKSDAPSGTAITLAEQIIQKLSRKNTWVNEPANHSQEIQILSERIDPAPGTHKVKFTSAIDDIEIIHTAHNRIGFAGGAVMAAEFVVGKQGIFTMQDVLGFK